nr:MAG TPA: hypothetical protein [Caudoviricetes sp.]
MMFDIMFISFQIVPLCAAFCLQLNIITPA